TEINEAGWWRDGGFLMEPLRKRLCGRVALCFERSVWQCGEGGKLQQKSSAVQHGSLCSILMRAARCINGSGNREFARLDSGHRRLTGKGHLHLLLRRHVLVDYGQRRQLQ